MVESGEFETVQLPLLYDRVALEAMPPAEVVDYALGLADNLVKAYDISISLARLQLQRDHEQTAHQEILVDKAERDSLTNLLNKKAWAELVEIEAQERSKYPGSKHLGVVFIDLSRFKNVNDALGHAVGDDVLIKTAALMEKSMREDPDKMAHALSRFGGDEFSILCDLVPRTDTEKDDSQRLKTIIERLRQAFKQFFTDEGLEPLGVDVAIGGAVLQSNQSVADLLKQADKAMYADKFARLAPLTDYEKEQLKGVLPILDKVGIRVEHVVD